MEQLPNDDAIADRLRRLVGHTYPQRGRFGALEAVSGISASRWKNFFYRKQNATHELLQFWCKKYPDSADWLLTGIEAPEQKEFPFSARVPRRWSGQTVGDRLNWVISEWASPSGEALFDYLEEKSGGAISAADWAKVVLRTAEPTIEMIALVCGMRPQFTEWVVRGSSSDRLQVDPTDQVSINRWKAAEKESWNAFTKDFLGACPKHDD